ncbi:MAG: 2-phospho-L-lactate transferase [Pseudomonadota bacterium]
MSDGKLAVTLLAGGVGGAKMAEGFAGLPGVDLTVIGNVGDDDQFHGLWVSPDIDTLIYTLSGRIDRDQGWGVADEGTRALQVLAELGQDTWMTLGDRDLGLHIYRTMRRRKGHRPSDITADIARAFGVPARIVLSTDDKVTTRVKTEAGWQSFQEYFVRDKTHPDVLALDYLGADDASATPEALAAIQGADLIVIAPSNPLASIKPILSIPGIAPTLAQSEAPKVAVSPLIEGAAVKGPAARMMQSLGKRADALGVAKIYREIAQVLLIDTADRALKPEIEAEGLRAVATDIMMPDQAAKARLAGAVLEAAGLAVEVRA